VNDLSFTIEAGERVGFLGPNGAGKTTTLKVLAGLLHPTSGSVAVAGHRPELREHAFLKRITLVMGQKQQLIWDLPPVETFAQNRAIYDIPEAAYASTMKELDQLLGLSAIRVEAHPAAFARRADEVRACGCAAPPARRALSRRADDQ